MIMNKYLPWNTAFGSAGGAGKAGTAGVFVGVKNAIPLWYVYGIPLW